MADTIGNAWAEMVTNQDVTTEDIRKLVNQVADELIEASIPKGTKLEDIDRSNPIQLDGGVRIIKIVNEEIRETIFRTTASIQRDGKRLIEISAQLNTWDRSLGISTPRDPSGFDNWSEENGPQKAWVLENLRQQVIEYLRS